MEALIALTVGVLVAAAVYLMLARNVLRFLFGLILISNAANLVIFVSGRLTPRVPPLIAPGALSAEPGVANALPQALVLTAIVIGFGLFAFSLVLVFRAYESMGTLDGDRMRVAEPVPGQAPAPRPDLQPGTGAMPSNPASPRPQPAHRPRPVEAQGGIGAGPALTPEPAEGPRR